MRYLSVALLVLAGCASGEAPASAPAFAPFGTTVTVPAVRPPLEPGREFAGNDQAVLTQLRTLVARPESDSAAVVAEFEAYGPDRIAPVVAVEYARRLKLLNNPDWRYWYEKAQLRAKFDQRACTDPSAPQFLTVALMEYQQLLTDHHDTSGLFTSSSEDSDKDRFPALRRIIDEGSGFNSKASAWWMCSHGMSAMMSGISGRRLSLESWWTGEAALKEARGQAEAVIIAALKEKGL